MSGEKETTEPQALVAAETPQDEIERLRKVLDEVQTNQAEHAAHLDRLAHRADLERAERAADRMRLNALAQEVKELRENAAADRLSANKAIDAMHYRRMVGNLFRRVADAVDGG